MSGDGVIFTREEARRTEAAVKHFERSQRGILAPALKKVRASVGGSSSCPEVHRFWTNGPTAGTFDVDYTYNGVTETLTFNYNTTATQFETELLTHSEFTSADVLTVDGGPFPNIAIYVTFNEVVAFPAIDDTSLTNGTVLMDKFSTAG